MINKNNSMMTKGQITEKFVREIEIIVRRNGLDYMDAVVHYCEENNIEIEVAANLIKSNLKIKTAIQNQAEKLNYLPKSKSQLDLD